MKKLLPLLVILSILVLPLWGWASYAEVTKKLCVPDTKICMTISERAPDFVNFPTQIIGTNKFHNGNALQILEAINEAETVATMIAVVKVDDRISVVALQVTYVPEGLRKFDPKKERVTDLYEDVAFTKTGRVSGVLAKVDKLTEYDSFSKFVEGTKI